MELNEHFKILKEYVTTIIKSEGYLQSLFVCSAGGLGKTTVVLNTLEELEIKDFVYINSYSTPVELINLLYQYNDKIIVFDDVETMFALGSKVTNIFKGVLWGIGKDKNRIVSYHTTSKLLRAPSSFEFVGKLIFLLNKLPNKEDPLTSAMMSRSIVYEMKFTRDEILDILKEFSKLPYKELSEEERIKLFTYLVQNTDNSNTDLSFRTLIKIYDIYTHNKDKWENLVKPLLQKDERLYLIKQLLGEHNVKEAQKEFSEITGLSRASFYRLKTKLI
jgi:hypothetical protein